MRRSFFAVALATLLPLGGPSLAPATAAAQLPPPPEDPRLLDAYLAWDRGDYPEALRGYLAVLRGPDGDAFVREVARLTGEVHPVRELAPDGGDLNVAADGGYVSFEVTDGEETVTRIVDPARDGTVIATVPGEGARLGPSGALALYRERSTPETESAARALDQARSGGDRGAMISASRELAVARARATDLFVRPSPDGSETQIDLSGQLYVAHAWSRWDPDLWVLTGAPGEPAHLLRVRDGGVAERIALGPQPARDVVPTGVGEVLVPLQPRGIARVRDGEVVGVYEEAGQPTLSAAGDRAAWVAELGDGSSAVRVAELASAEIGNLFDSEDPVANAAISPDGEWVAYQARPVHDWEIFAVRADGSGEPVQLTWEIQHDLFPTWIDDTTVLAAKGEGRHRRSYLYSLDGGDPLKLFHNNTIRTIAPEYEWAATPGGGAVAIVSERDGDTVSPERGVYLVDLTAEVGKDEVIARLEAMLAAEEDLRDRGERAFAPIAAEVREVTEAIDVGRIYLAARDLYRMGSKHITQPGNAKAIEYYERKLRAYGYEPELQWFEPRPGIRTANIIARLPGTRDPEVVYVASSHFDSVERGPGADDDTSGGTALLEAARAMKDHPMPATIEFAFFTGEEAGLLGSREYVRRAVAEGKHIVGALNNDMIGWANDHRLDNTIRYSNPGIRDIQHAAAMQFSDLITFDALYYKNTDAHAYYEEYGDIVGGIGSYPVLGNPHYHQFTDRLETIDQQLVAAVSRTTAATLMLLASAPSRLAELTAAARGGQTEVSWQPAVESDVESYTVRWEGPDGRTGEREVPASSGGERVSVALPDVPAGSRVEVRAVDRDGLVGWDWARADVTGG